MKRVTAIRGDTLVLVDELGRPLAFPPGAVTEVERILTTPATERRSRRTDTGIAEDFVTLQPGEDGHAATSLIAAGFTVVEQGATP